MSDVVSLLEPRVLGVIADALCCRHGQRHRPAFTGQTLLGEGLGCDSLDRVSLVVAIEEEFAIEISDDTEASWRTVGDIVATVASLAAAPSPA